MSKYIKSNSKVLQYKGITYKGYLIFNSGKVFDFNFTKTWLPIRCNVKDRQYVAIKIIDKDTHKIKRKNIYLDIALKENFEG